MMKQYGISRFPDELVSNEKKKSFEFAKDYASAIWSEWESQFYSRNLLFEKLEKYANGEQDIERLENNITNNGKLIKKEFLRYDKKDKVKFLPKLLRAFYNSVDMSEFVPIVKATDPTAMEVKSARKAEKVKLFHAKDFINDIAALNGGQSPVPPEMIPQSKEQIDLEEETAKPLRVERGELKALEFISLINNFDLQTKQYLIDEVIYNLMVASVTTDPVEGIKISRVNPFDFVHGERKDNFFSTSQYFGEVKEITVGTFKNITAESNLKFSDKDIKKMAGISEDGEITESDKIKVISYSFKTFFQEVYKKKINRETKAINLVDRTKDIGTDKEYNPKMASDKSEKIVDNYDVWFEGIMVLNGDEKTVIRHRLAKNLPEYKGRILPPYIVCSPRKIGIVEECIPKIDAIQELRLRLLHHRNNLKGNITEIDPDAIANISLGTTLLTPQEVLSYYFTMGLAFRKTKDEDGEFIQNNRPLSEIPESIPRALIELTNQYISEIQDLRDTFGAFQYEMAKADPKTMQFNEPFRMSDNTAMRDYTDHLYKFCIKIYQTASSRLNDAFKWSHIRDMFIDNIGTEDMDAIEQYRKDRKSHYFDVYLDYIPSKKERDDFEAAVQIHIANRELTALDKMELMMIRNPLQARASLKLRLDSNQKKMQDSKMQEIQAAKDGNIEASNVAAENKAKLSAQDHAQRVERQNLQFNQEAFLLQKQGEIKIIEAKADKDSKAERLQWEQQFQADITKYKKEQDAILRKEVQQISAENQAQMIRMRQGKAEGLSNEQQQPEVDLSQLQNA